jgi:hypothetical protein
MGGLEQNQRYYVLSKIPLNVGFLKGKPARTFLPPSYTYAGFALETDGAGVAKQPPAYRDIWDLLLVAKSRAN